MHFKTSISLDIHAIQICIQWSVWAHFGDHACVHIAWASKQQFAVSHSITQAQKKELFHQTQVSGWKDYPHSLCGIFPVMSVDPLVANAGRDSTHHVYFRKDNMKKSCSKWYLRSVKSGMYLLSSRSPALPFCVRRHKNGGTQSKYGTNVGTVEEKG